MIQKQRTTRRGVILPLMAVCAFTLIGFTALAIDLGVIAVARNQAQNAADAGALAGVRELNGDNANNNNKAGAAATAQTVASSNAVMGGTIAANQVYVTVGSYSYDGTLTPPGFKIDYFNKPSGEAWTLVHVEVGSTGLNQN